MTTQIDFRTLPANVPVLCIPRVYSNITEARIRKIFEDLNMGELERIDVVSKTSVKPGTNPSEKGDKFNRVFVHFRRWNNSENSNTARERLLNGKEIKIIYDDPWFWKISAYRESERRPAPQRQPSGSVRKPTIAFDSDEDKSSKSRVTDRRDERPRRRDDSRERPRRDERPRRRDDSRERKSEVKSSAKQDMPQRKFIESDDKAEQVLVEPGNSSCSSPRERPEPQKELLKVDYGNVPPLKRRIIKKSERIVLKIENENEEEKQTETA